MKKILALVIAFTAMAALSSCGPDPVKAMGDAQTAINRAKDIGAPTYSPDNFTGAVNDYNEASNFITNNKKEDAYKMAVSSKEKADKSFEDSRVKRAEDIFNKNTALMGDIDQAFGPKIAPDRTAKAVTDYNAFSNIYVSKDYDKTWDTGTNLNVELNSLLDYLNSQINRVKSVIAEVQDRYDQAANDPDMAKYAKDGLLEVAQLLDDARTLTGSGELDAATNKAAEADSRLITVVGAAKAEIAKDKVAAVRNRYLTAEKSDMVVKYALEDLKKALLVIDEAATALDGSDYDKAIERSKEADRLIDEAMAKAQDAYQKAQADSQNQLNLEKQREREVQKEKAENYIDEAKKRLERLKSIKKQGFLRTINGNVAAAPAMIVIGQGAYDVPYSGEPVKEEPGKMEEKPSIELVEKYIQMAEEAYAREEYLDAIDYAREAIRISDLLIADEAGAEYTVKLNPANRDCLWKISGYMYENKTWLWPVIWRANKFQIKDPDLIYPGQVFKVPPDITK